VGDEGISLGKLERVIEADFLFGSRRQELQRLGRLFHSEFKGEHHIIMTEEEYSLYKKRLYGVLEKGFEINIHK
jgi:DNA excision repair protein ERCC-3